MRTPTASTDIHTKPIYWHNYSWPELVCIVCFLSDSLIRSQLFLLSVDFNRPQHGDEGSNEPARRGALDKEAEDTEAWGRDQKPKPSTRTQSQMNRQSVQLLPPHAQPPLSLLVQIRGPRYLPLQLRT